MTRLESKRKFGGRWVSATVVGFATSLAVTACGGSQKQPEEPPLLEQPSGDVAAPTTKKVQEGLELIRAQRFADAEKVLAEATREAPKDPQAAFYYGVALEGVEKWDEAEASYDRALTLEPKLTEASQNLSALLLESDKIDKAISVVDAGLKFTPEDPGLLGNRALALDAKGSPDAIPAYQKVLAKKPDDAWLRYNYATALAVNEKTAEAGQELAKVPVDDPQLAAQVAQLYGKLKDFQGCVAALDKAIGKNKTAELLVHRGICKHSLGDDKAALADLEAAVATDSSNAAAHYYLGKHLGAQGKKADAETHLKKAVELGKDTPIAAAAEKALAELKALAAKKK